MAPRCCCCWPGLILVGSGLAVATAAPPPVVAAAASVASACLLDPSLPPHLAAHAAEQPLCAGFINVSAPPYSAAGDGATDDSASLQSALDDAYAHRMVVLLPAGRTFVLAKQLRAVQRFGLPPDREHGYQLVGQRGAVPPMLRVLDGTSLEGFPVSYESNFDGTGYVARPVLLYALNMTGQANAAASHYSAMLRNVDIDLGDNPQLSGVSMSGAQLCSIEDVRVSGKHFTAGFVGLPGSGGYSANIRVTGGQFGVWQKEYRPNPSISGFVASNQSVAAVLVEVARGPLVISGFVVRLCLASVVTGVMATGQKGGDGALSLEDGIVVMEGAAISAPAISTHGPDVALRHVWVQSPDAVTFELYNTLLASEAGVMKSIPEWWFSAATSRGVSSSIAYSDGVNVSARATKGFPVLALPVAAPSTPPDDATIVTMHSWTRELEQSLAWDSDSSVMLDAVRDCGATPSWVNSTDDDGAAISACLHRSRNGSAVFVPRGEFLLWAPLVLRSGQKLIGAGKHCATLMMRPGFVFDTAPLVELAGVGSALSDLVLITAQRGTILTVNAANSFVRDLRTSPCTKHKKSDKPLCAVAPPPRDPPTARPVAAGVRFTGGVSGRFFGLCLDHFREYLVPGDALLSVNDVIVGSGVHLYQLSVEHLATDYQVQVRASFGIHMHAMKYESAGFLAHPSWGPPGGGLFSCHASTNVSIFGGSGNFGIMNASMASSILLAQDCPDMQLSSMVRKPQPGEAPGAWIRSAAGYDEDVTIEIDDSVPALLAFSALTSTESILLI
eukprot:TRINITY_DN15405_c0_g1_i1.p1 TRINITY_DN15405_c0_g1~~TRINITY_DN15405_c0_g1_i1.p1  ORF type:complete len:810 (+),score=88.38 TRINITY_DN15405_c0_g1_i1:73-2430(+)